MMNYALSCPKGLFGFYGNKKNAVKTAKRLARQQGGYWVVWQVDTRKVVFEHLNRRERWLSTMYGRV